jgi:hypothetical protein
MTIILFYACSECVIAVYTVVKTMQFFHLPDLHAVMAMLQEFGIDAFRIQNGIALVIVNRLFEVSWLPNRQSLADRTNILTFCENNNYDLYFYEDLEAQAMKDVCRAISNMDLCSYDAFICFISSYGDKGDLIYGRDGLRVTVDDIVTQFIGKRTLANKPKLFFMQNSRGRIIGQDPQAAVGAGRGEYPPTTIRLPMEVDFLVAYSSVDGYESYWDANRESFFITVLTEVLNEDEHNMNLTDLLSMVNKKVSSLDDRGRRQIPCFMSTLRKSVHFVMPRVIRRATRVRRISESSVPDSLDNR